MDFKKVLRLDLHKRHKTFWWNIVLLAPFGESNDPVQITKLSWISLGHKKALIHWSFSHFIANIIQIPAFGRRIPLLKNEELHSFSCFPAADFTFFVC